MSVTTEVRPGDTDDVVGNARSHLVVPDRSTFQQLIATDARTAAALARLSLGLVMLPHALQKTLGWFGGAGFYGYASSMEKLGVAGPLAFLVMLAELFGSLGLIVGVLTRVSALAIMTVMLGAIAIVHAPHGFFMNWAGTKAGEGFEYHLLAIGLALVCLLEGGGRVSIDRALMRWRPSTGGSVSPALAGAEP